MEENTSRPPGLVLTVVVGRIERREEGFICQDQQHPTNNQSFKTGNAMLSGRKVNKNFFLEMKMISPIFFFERFSFWILEMSSSGLWRLVDFLLLPSFLGGKEGETV